jgi:hypothetical protein
MWFLLAFGVLTLVGAARFAAQPEFTRLRLVVTLGITTWFATLTAVSAALAEVGHHVPEYVALHPALSLSAVLLQGAAESMAPAILGFTVLSLATLVVALGFHRESSPSN